MSEQKVVLVTGANKGIGKAIVKEILKRADTVVFLGSRDETRGKAAIAEIERESPEVRKRVHLLLVDVTDVDSIARAAEEVRTFLSQQDLSLYGLVNNAGVGFSEEMKKVLTVNTLGPKRVCDAFLPLLMRPGGRVVNISSASGPNFLSQASEELCQSLRDPEVSWEKIEGIVDKAIASEGRFGGGNAYGLSKALVNAYTIYLARENEELLINACTPGFIETDLTRQMARQRGSSPEEMGMKPPKEGAKSALLLLFGDPGGSGWYFGSDGLRSPLDRYRAPGDPPYEGR